MITPDPFKRASAQADFDGPSLLGHFLTAAGFFDREEAARAAEQKVFAFEKFLRTLAAGGRSWNTSGAGNGLVCLP
jgi:hypothetical protein